MQLISHVIGYPSIDLWNSLETYGQPCKCQVDFEYIFRFLHKKLFFKMLADQKIDINKFDFFKKCH